MRLKSLYLKIFLSFMGILILTETLILALFIFGAARHFRDRVEINTGYKMNMARTYVEDLIRAEARGGSLTGPEQEQALVRLVAQVARTYQAQVWIVDGRGEPLAKSFGGPVPEGSEFRTGFPADRSDRIKVRKRRNSPWEYYATVPLALPDGRTGFLHIISNSDTPEGHQIVFVIGLIVIGTVIALLTVPVSRLITRPVNRLRRSAIRIADGELSHRARINTRDEIGQLGRGFNHMADRLEEMIRGGKELTANVSHELRSPLARIRVAQELIRRKAEQEGYTGLATHLDNIREDIEEQDRIIERIMALSKMDLSEEPLKPGDLDPAETAAGILDRFRDLVEKKNLGLSTSLDPQGPLRADRKGYLTLLTNLIDNAVKFAPPGGRVEVRMFRRGPLLVHEFSNTFAPLDPAELERIFQPFHKADPAAGGGAGLGLAIVKKIVEKHGGAISASSQGGEFRVRVELPLGD